VLGAVNMSIHHKLCHTLGGTFNLPHAETHTVILPHATAYNLDAAADAMRRIAAALGANDAAEGIYDLIGRIGAPRALKDIGIAEARIFDRSALERAEQELKRQYITRGKYAANVQTTVTPQERNRVAINFTIDEGDSAKIARINIVGARAFTEKQLLSEMTLTTPGWLTWYTKNDQYSKQKLSADLEALRSFYQNRGYLEFNVDSTQVSISPDKDDIFITLNITEGPLFTVGDVRVAGDLVVPADDLERLIRVKPGEVFSRERLQASAKSISDRLGAEGYAFANVNAVPELDRAKQTASFTFFVDPGRRAYVRKINISGNAKTRDEVIRRGFRQLEDAWYDGPRIDRSMIRV
jgi:outer membrane protein insertion porin family